MSKKNTPGKIEELLKDLSHWTYYKKGMCDSCEGLCCYMPVEVKTSDLIRLGILAEFHLEMTLKEQIRDALKHPGVQRYTASTENFTLTQKSDSTCFFLDSNKRCSHYDIRPDTCRNHPIIGPRPGFCAYMKKE